VVGSDAGALVGALLRVGVDARNADGLEGCSVLADASFSTVVACISPPCAGERLSEAMVELGRIAGRSVVVVVGPDNARTQADTYAETDSPIASRSSVDAAAFAAGLRRHPMSLGLTSYNALDVDAPPRVMAYERIPATAMTDYPQQWLQTHHDLHDDHLRQSGRRADAHVARYWLASDWVKEGDTVLDAACGLGYGIGVLGTASGANRLIGVDGSSRAIDYARANYGGPRSVFEVSDVGVMPFLADGSIDFVASFETLEHVEKPGEVLAEFYRVLSPGGRIIVSVPNNWADETRKDPNPHHLHVYTQARLRSELSEHFVIEQWYRQTAGGGWKCRDEPRCIEAAGEEADGKTDVDSSRPAEWWLVVAVKPVGNESPGRAMQAARLDHRFAAALRLMCSGQRAEAKAAFAALAGNQAGDHAPALWAVDALRYAGILHAMDGEVNEARALWLRGIELAVLALQDWKSRGIADKGAVNLDFGLSELAKVVAAAAGCERWIAALPRLIEQPGFAWQAGMGRDAVGVGGMGGGGNDAELVRKAAESAPANGAARAAALAEQLTDTRRHVTMLEEARTWLEAQVESWRTETQKTSTFLERITHWSKELEEAKKWWEGQHAAEKVESARLWAAFEQERDEAAQHATRVEAQIEDRDAQLAAQRETIEGMRREQAENARAVQELRTKT